MRSILLLFALALGACASDSPYVQAQHGNASSMTTYARSLIGAPYKYGGTSPDSGFDCSGFVGHVFMQKLGKALPRSSRELSRVGTAQKSGMLKPGDLVFYNTLNKNYSHVGTYLV